MTTTTAYESWSTNGVIGIRNTQGRVLASSDPAELLNFLRYSASQTLRVTWSLDDFIAPILRLLPSGILERLSRFEDDLSWQGHELYYLPERMFRVGKSRFYGIRDFWGSLTDEKPSLETVQEQANDLLSTLDQIGLPDPRKLTSPPAVFEDSEWGKRVYSKLPKGYDLPADCLEMLEYAGKADGKDWVSNHYIGHLKKGEIWDYDINACYASIASRLPDIRGMNIWKSNKYGIREEMARLGIVQGKFYIDTGHPYAHCSPIIGPVGDLPGNPLGRLPEDYYSLDEVRYISKSGLGTFKMHDGWFADSETSFVLPFSEVMLDLYRKRSISPLASSVCKIIANAIIGKLIETKVTGDYGPIRNDLYHALITSRARIEVSKFLIQHEIRPEELVCVQTDGCKLTRNIPLPTNGMGSWLNKGSEATILISPYKIYSAGAKPYRLTYDDIVGMVEEHPLSQRYEKTIRHRLTMVQAIRQYEDVTKVGETIDLPNSVDLITLEEEQNRVFEKIPRTGRGLLEGKFPSRPFAY